MDLFRGEASRKVALYLFLRRGSETLGSVQRAAGLSKQTAIWALNHLVADSVVSKAGQPDGFPRYSANRDHPLAAELMEMAVLTMGGNDDLVRKLAGMDAVSAIAVFGGYAKGTFGPGSDIDLLVVETRPDPAAHAALSELEAAVLRMGIVLNPHIATEAALRDGSRFMDSVAGGALKPIKGFAR